MADDETVNVDGRPISSLRVVDLKKECEKRSLSKSGSKSQLVERLKTHLLLEKLQQPSDSDYSSDAGIKTEEEGGAQNEFIKQYLERQKLLLEGGDSEKQNKPSIETGQSDTSLIEESSPVKQQAVESSLLKQQAVESSPLKQQTVESSAEKTDSHSDIDGEESTVVANSEKANSEQYPVQDSETHRPAEEPAVNTDIVDPEQQTVNSSPDKLVTDTENPVPDELSTVIAKSEKSHLEEQAEPPVEITPVNTVSANEHPILVEQSVVKVDAEEFISGTDIQITETHDSGEDYSSEEEMGRSKRKSAKHESRAEKKEKKEKESSRRSRRKSEKMDDEEETHLENGKKIDVEENQSKDLGDSEAAVEKVDVRVNEEDKEVTGDSAKTNGVEKDSTETEENVNNSAEFTGKQRRGSGPIAIEASEKSEKKNSESKDEEMRGRRGSHSDGRMSRRKSDEKMDSEVTSSQDKKAQQKHSAGRRQSGRKARKHSSSSSRSRSHSRSRSRSPSPSLRSKGKKSRSSSSASSRSRSPPAKTKSAIVVERPPSRTSSSSRSRSRSPTPKRVKMKDRSDSESSRSRTPSPQRSHDKEASRRSRSRSSSRSRSRSPVPERMSADSTDEPPIDHKEKSFYTEEEESPLPVKVKSRASLEVVEKTVAEPVKAGLTEEKEVEDESEVPQVEISQTELSQESEKPVVPVKHTKKISLNRGKSSDLSKPSEGEGEKVEDGEKPAKKRKWGSKSTTSLQNKPKKTSSVTISTESLKGLMPDLKPSLKLAEPVLEEMDYEDDEDIAPSTTEQQQPEDTRDVKIQRTVLQEVKDNPDSPTSSDDEDSREREEKTEIKEEEGDEPPVKRERKKTGEERETITKTITITRKEKSDQKIVRQVSHKPAIPLIKPDEPEAARRSPSPARNPVGKIVHVRNLVRPFTLGQLKELLRRSGPFNEDSFWIDKIKSHCFVTYETEEDAVKTRRALHNTRWPQSNPKTLSVDFGTEEQVEFHKKEEVPKAVFPQKDRATLRKEREAKREQEKLEREKEIEKRRMEREKRMKEKEEREMKNKPKPVREWDREKLEKGDWDRTRVRSRSPRVRRRSEGSESPVRERRISRDKKEKKEKQPDEPPAKLLDDLFRKTKTTPCIYWLPLTEAQTEEKEKARKNRIQERLKNLAAMELPDENPTKENRSSPPAREERNKERGSPPPRRRQSSDERPRRTSDERPRRASADRSRQRAERRDSRSRSGRRR